MGNPLGQGTKGSALHYASDLLRVTQGKVGSSLPTAAAVAPQSPVSCRVGDPEQASVSPLLQDFLSGDKDTE